MQWLLTTQVQFFTWSVHGSWSHLDAGSPGVVCSVRLVSRVGQPRQPANVGLGAWPLSKPNGVPDAGQPVRHQGEGAHQQDQDCGPVLRVPKDSDTSGWRSMIRMNVPVYFSRHPDKSEQPGGLEQPDECRGLKWEFLNWVWHRHRANAVSTRLSAPITYQVSP